VVSVCFGGTFSVLHMGHKRLLKRSIALGDEIEIGITTDRLARKMCKSHEIKKYEDRVSSLMNFVKSLDLEGKKVTTLELENLYGPTLTRDYDYITVSPETRPTAVAINKIRMAEGKRPIRIVLTPFVLAKDFLPISVTRILKGEIDEDGELKVTFKAAICGLDDHDLEAAIRGELGKLSNRVKLSTIEGPSKKDPISTAISGAIKASNGMTLGIGFGFSDSTYCAVVDGTGAISLVLSSNPEEGFRKVMKKKIGSLEGG